MNGDRRNCFCNIKYFVDAQADAEHAQQAFKFLVEFVDHEADADMGFDAAFGEMEYRSGFEGALGDTERAFDNPQAVVLVNYLARGQAGVGDVAFESVPSGVGAYLVLVDADHDIVLDDEELVVPPD